jgi:1,4-dihydroxy-2-naphthoyl-CoA hydrolase
VSDPNVPRPETSDTGGALPTPAEMNALLAGRLPGLIGMRVTDVRRGGMSGELDVRDELLAPNGYLHAATVIALADTLCGLGCRLVVPSDSNGFTTLELKSSFLGTSRSGTVRGEATCVHNGRRTQVWDASVSGADGRTIALFRCTQLVLYP